MTTIVVITTIVIYSIINFLRLSLDFVIVFIVFCTHNYNIIFIIKKKQKKNYSRHWSLLLRTFSVWQNQRIQVLIACTGSALDMIIDNIAFLFYHYNMLHVTLKYFHGGFIKSDVCSSRIL